jgi:hypothetical protein
MLAPTNGLKVSDNAGKLINDPNRATKPARNNGIEVELADDRYDNEMKAGLNVSIQLFINKDYFNPGSVLSAEAWAEPSLPLASNTTIHCTSYNSRDNMPVPRQARRLAQ